MVWEIAGLVLLAIVIVVGLFLLCELAIRVGVWMLEEEPLIKERDDEGYL